MTVVSSTFSHYLRVPPSSLSPTPAFAQLPNLTPPWSYRRSTCGSCTLSFSILPSERVVAIQAIFAPSTLPGAASASNGSNDGSNGKKRVRDSGSSDDADGGSGSGGGGAGEQPVVLRCDQGTPLPNIVVKLTMENGRVGARPLGC